METRVGGNHLELTRTNMIDSINCSTDQKCFTPAAADQLMTALWRSDHQWTIARKDEVTQGQSE